MLRHLPFARQELGLWGEAEGLGRAGAGQAGLLRGQLCFCNGSCCCCISV